MSISILPHQSADLFITDGGLETTLIFLKGIELPGFAAFSLLNTDAGCHTLKEYYRGYLDIAAAYHSQFILESPTWRANPDWIEKLGYPSSYLAEINTKAIALMQELKEEYLSQITNIVISGCIGPRGDGYVSANEMQPDAAQQYHAQQIQIFKKSGADMVSAFTMNYVAEAIGIARAAEAANIPCVISFTVENNGKLQTGMSLQDAIQQVDESVATRPIYYMVNCAHPTHFMQEMQKGKNAPWVQRIKGIRANASCKSHQELDEATELDRGNLEELGEAYEQLKKNFSQLNVFGGCCGTDDEHVREMASHLQMAVY